MPWFLSPFLIQTDPARQRLGLLGSLRRKDRACKALDPLLMADVHRVRLRLEELCGWLALLGLLREDADASLVQVLKEPCMHDIEPVVGVGVALGPAVPGKTARLAICRRLELDDLGLDGEAEGLEAEAGVRCKLRALGVVELDVSCIVVAGRPDGSIDQVLEDIGSRGATDDDLVRGEVVGGSREVLVRSRDLVQHFMHPFVSARRTLQHAIPFLSSLLYAGRISMSCPSGSVMK